MIAFLSDNLGTIIVAVMLAAILAAVIWKLGRDKKHGKTSCGCGCEGCALKDQCHSSPGRN
ncbi:MAG: FeoB-associated Cys-rich membrane protein [Oscillospiraceae bacterium]|nr:FeoB-associated Cys-rich membrane protein [Oscillospiraceae bacterium]